MVSLAVHCNDDQQNANARAAACQLQVSSADAVSKKHLSGAGGFELAILN